MIVPALSQLSPAPSSCAVCGSQDARTLSATPLASGATVIVCGSHAVAHARAGYAARSVKELRFMLAERRTTRERRGSYATAVAEAARSLSITFKDERSGRGRRAVDQR
jgi:hypothetical protein